MKPLNRVRDWRLIHGAVVVIVAALFLIGLQGVLYPPVLFIALAILMIPYSGTEFHRLMLLTGVFVLALWLLGELGTLLAPFVLAFVLAYVLDPLVDRLVERRVPRSLAVVILGLPGVGALLLLVLLGLPALADQIQALIRRAPEAVNMLAGSIENLQNSLLGMDIPFVDEEAIAQRLRTLSPETVTGFLEEKQAEIGRRAWAAVLGLGRGIGTVFTILGYLVLTPVLTFYLLRDYDTIIERLSGYVPRPRLTRWTAFATSYDDLLSRYLRGQLLAAAIVGVLTWLGLWIAGFPSPGLVGAVAGIFNVIPYMGLLVSLVPAVIIALLSGAFLSAMLKVAIVFGIVQMLDANVIGPKIVGESVGLHPVWVILAIATGGYLYGFVGLLLAIPGAILVKLLLEVGGARYRTSTVYLGGTGRTDAG